MTRKRIRGRDKYEFASGLGNRPEEMFMAEWKPKPDNPKQKVWVEFVNLSDAAQMVSRKKSDLSRILEEEGKYEAKWVTIYSRRRAESEGKLWREKAN